MSTHCHHDDHQHAAGCGYCACHNPLIVNVSKSEFAQQVLTELTTLASKTSTKQKLISESNANSAFMYHGGTIRSVRQGNAEEVVEAIGFYEGKVHAVGRFEHVYNAMLATGMSEDNCIQLSGQQTLLPGLIEPHAHIVPTALFDSWVSFIAFDEQHLKSDYSIEWFKSQLKAVGTEQLMGGWLLGQGLDPALMGFKKCASGLNELPIIDVTMLDQLVCDLQVTAPIFIMSASMHTAYVNSMALAATYPFLSEQEKAKYSNVEDYVQAITRQGALQEMAQMKPALEAIVASAGMSLFNDIPTQIEAVFKTALERGTTFIYDAGTDDFTKAIMELYLASKDVYTRVGYARIVESQEDVDNLPTFPELTEDHVDTFYNGNIKVLADGSNQGLTGYQSAPYDVAPSDNYGVFNFPDDPNEAVQTTYNQFDTLIASVIEKGWPLMIHANGDQANWETLKAYELGLKGKSGIDKRHRIEHASLLTDEAVELMTKLGVSPSFLIGHVGYWGWVFQQAIFEEKVNILDRCRTMLDNGARITLHSDLSVSPIGPLRLMEQAVTRIMEQCDVADNVLMPEERISRSQALRAITYDAAWQCHAERWVGSLEVGKKADFIILEDDPMTITDATKIRDIQTEKVFIGGQQKYPF